MLLGLLIAIAALFGAFFAVIAVGTGHAHHSEHRHAAEGVLEFAILLLPLGLLSFGIALMASTTRVRLRIAVACLALTVLDGAIVAWTNDLVRDSQRVGTPVMPDRSSAPVVVMPARRP